MLKKKMGSSYGKFQNDVNMSSQRRDDTNLLKTDGFRSDIQRIDLLCAVLYNMLFIANKFSNTLLYLRMLSHEQVKILYIPCILGSERFEEEF